MRFKREGGIDILKQSHNTVDDTNESQSMEWRVSGNQLQDWTVGENESFTDSLLFLTVLGALSLDQLYSHSGGYLSVHPVLQELFW
jgi:hypothetical protein